MNNAPARPLEAAIRGRPYTAAPVLLGGVGGPDATAYRIGACRALEGALGLEVDERTEAARRLLCCAAWIAGHATHIHLVQAPGYLDRPDAASLARAEPDAVARGLALYRLGADLAEAVGRGTFEPCSVHLGRFWPPPEQAALTRLLPRLRDAVGAGRRTVHWVCGFDIPESVLDVPMLALDDPARTPSELGAARYPLDGGIGVLVSNGLGFPLSDFESFVSRPRSAADHPTRAALRGTRAVLTGPLARYALCGRALRPAARDAARYAGLERGERNPYRSVLVRAVELVHALEEAAELVERFEPPPAARPPKPRAGRGLAAVEGPSGLLYQRYDLAPDGTVTAVRLVGPGELNRTAIELDLRRTARETRRRDPGNPAARLAAQRAALEHLYQPCVPGPVPAPHPGA